VAHEILEVGVYRERGDAICWARVTNNTDSIPLGGWTMFSGAVSYRRGHWEYAVNAENLFNRQRYFLGSDYDNQVYPGAPINVFATARFRF